MEDARTVHYVTQDPMAHLKLRVTLTRLSAAKSKVQQDQGFAQGVAAPAGASGQGSSAADAAAATTATGTGSIRPSGRPAPFQVSRTFSWQEKVYSKAELVAAQAHIRSNQQGAQFMSPKRTAHFGSQSHIGTDRLLTAGPDGSLLFSYVQTDDFCKRYETSRSITTSRWEGQNHLANKLLVDPRNRQKMLNFHSMFIMADLGDEHTVAGSIEKVLAVIRAHRDGSFDMTPGFNAPGHKTRIEDDHGGIYEYTIELASRGAAPCLERRTAKLAGAVAEELQRNQSSMMEHSPPPGPDGAALRLLLLAELVSAAGFQRDRLYVEWQLHFDPELWVLQHSEQEVLQPGLVQGVTHVSQMTQYPADAANDTPALWVAHFAHPIEVEWVARTAPTPKDWPRLLLQVCTYDLWDRVTTEGYGWLQLSSSSSGSCTHYVDTWKPLGTRRDQQQAFFTGGSEELADMSYAAVPKGHKGRVLNKYGYKTQTAGTVKVRVNSVVQGGSSGGTSPRKAPANKWPANNRRHRELSLAVVLERAHARLREARGGEVEVREGVVSQRPAVTVQPADVTVDEGGNAQLSIIATGMGPLRYQWFKDSKRLTVATSDTPLLVLVDVGVSDSGTYYCQVSNKDGAVCSSKALLNITRIGRVQHAAGAVTTAAEAGGSTGDQAASPLLSSLSNTITKRTTVPRSLASRPGGSLPYSPRFGGRSSSGSPSVSGTTSPLRGSWTGLQPVAGRFAGAAAAAGPGEGSLVQPSVAGGSALGGWAAGNAAGSPLRRSRQLAPIPPPEAQQQAAAEQQTQQQLVQGHDAEVQQELQPQQQPDLLQQSPSGRLGWAAAAGAAAASACPRRESSNEGAAAGASPARAPRRSRVSEQH
uniref:Ig-like domain-containing protein n=1 Tax=Tetradesmus obliquus TaxID=3088 RepID=A0A383VLW8_TETOB|eukprot:jgi/Sobl393_1/1440/SZX66171.1